MNNADDNQLQRLINEIKAHVSKQWSSQDLKDLCNGCRYFESSWNLLVKALYFLEDLRDKKCNSCEFYQGAHEVPGHAPCKFWGIGSVMHDDSCRRFKQYEKEPKSFFGWMSSFMYLDEDVKEQIKREKERFGIKENKENNDKF